ncbi:hypothetical protein PHYSODRAFT_492971 [Phytophthora sojae]|uniref:MULE transposase domain-containing protein n=1 Tax=Phytophthora sojae (strain P6497) TaxID=1094619 RepID=G4Z1X4_PHYSP|nr:hypothetical protein PHYSODRAFT_492971 [Phytophthora sojae]EGZ19972.1 hypothetical protein PHYSODRAFT_492971 [Phytophthora sojae]|eukprot:XP_009522689.1 hypothetical protein PHYSODRAFT_492971 [Phytophthora sojae]
MPLSNVDTQTSTSVSRSQQASKPRDGRTKLYYQGYSFVRANGTSNKISYRCSSYHSPCPAQFAFYASTMAFDFSSMEAHTCRAGPALRGATVNPGDHAIDASNDIMEEVDKLATQTTLTQRQIWMAIVDKFYMNDGAPVRGVSEKTVKNRVQEAWGHDSSHGRASIMTNPRLTKIKGSHQGFFQFQYAWHDDVKALKKPPKDANGIDQITAWAHPTLLNLLCFENLSWFIDGTFRCAPVDYKQCVTIMIYDLSSKLFLPVLHAATTSMTRKSYVRLLQCVQDAVGSKLVPKDVVCDFESSLIGALREFFPDVTIIGCLFHFKQACRRKMKCIGLPVGEIKVAMSRNVFDILTVIDPTKIAVQGITWVKAKICSVCEVKGLEYSRSKWRTFWSYFQRTWLETHPPEYWNVFGMRRDIISRTNNPLERFHRELNKRFNARPPMKTFVTSLENLAREYVAQRTTVISGLAKPPERTGFVLPRQPKLPEVSDIVDSPASSDGEGEIVDADADSEPYSSAMSSTGDENVEPGEYIQPDHSFEYDGET